MDIGVQHLSDGGRIRCLCVWLLCVCVPCVWRVARLSPRRRCAARPAAGRPVAAAYIDWAAARGTAGAARGASPQRQYLVRQGVAAPRPTRAEPAASPLVERLQVVGRRWTRPGPAPQHADYTASAGERHIDPHCEAIGVPEWVRRQTMWGRYWNGVYLTGAVSVLVWLCYF